MPKRNNLGYAEDEFLGEYVGIRAGLEVWLDNCGVRSKFVTVVDRALLDKNGMPRVAMQIDLSLQGNSWHVATSSMGMAEEHSGNNNFDMDDLVCAMSVRPSTNQ